MTVREIIYLQKDLKNESTEDVDTDISIALNYKKFQFNTQNVKTQALGDINKEDLVSARYRVTAG